MMYGWAPRWAEVKPWRHCPNGLPGMLQLKVLSNIINEVLFWLRWALVYCDLDRPSL